MSIQQNYPAIKPTLNLDFANTKQLDPRITYSRASTGTYYDAKTVAKAEENLLTFSEQFDNASWTVGGSTVTANASTAPDGTTTADKLVSSATTGEQRIYRGAGVSTTASQVYTYSVYAKSDTVPFVIFRDDFGGYGDTSFNISSGTVGTVASGRTATITSVGNGWYRCSVTATSSLATQQLMFCLASADNGRTSFTGNGTSGVLLWGAQLEQRSFATAYTPTTTAPITNYIPVLQTASAGTPRFDHNPITGESLGLLIEEQRTNLVTYSSDFDNAAWTKARASISANATAAPDGTTTADKLVEDTSASNTHQAFRSTSVSAGTPHTFSVYIKADGRNFAGVRYENTGSTEFYQVNVNLTNGTATTSLFGSPTGTSFSVTSAGNAWWRVSITVTTSNTGFQSVVYLQSVQGSNNYTGDGTSGIYIWGAQLEAGAFPTSYIPTALTYSGRASTGTFRGTNGLLQTAGVNTARYEINAGGGSNLLLENAASNLLNYTEHLDNAAWTKTRANIALNSAVAPDGTLTGDKLVEDTTANNTHFVMQTIAVTSGTSYTFSVYAKAAERSRILIAVSSAAFTANQAIFDLTNGTTSNLVACTASIAAVGNGWYRCSWTATATASASPTFNVFLETGTPTYTGDGTSGAHIWGAQLEAGSAATSYIPSIETWTGRASTATYFDSLGVIRTAASGQPRYSFNPTLLSVSSKLLLEPQATNLLTRSEEFQTGWTVERATVQTNATTAPDGALTADKLLEDTAVSNTHVLFQGTSSLTSGSILSFSVYVKASELSSLRLQINDGASLSNAVFANYDVSTGVASSTQSIGTFTDANSTITSVGNGWYRCSISGIATGVTAVQSRIFLVSGGATSYTGLGNRGVFVWGAQLETGAGATSYIPTVASQATRVADTSTSAAQSRAADAYSSSQVTRAADSASMTGTNFSSWYNPSEGSISQDFTSLGVSVLDRYSLIISDTGSPIVNSHNIRNYNGAHVAQSRASSATQGEVTMLPAISAGVPYKVAYAYKTNDFAGVRNGGSVVVNTIGIVPTGLTRLDLPGNGCNYLKKLSYYPRRLTNTQIQALTT